MSRTRTRALIYLDALTGLLGRVAFRLDLVWTAVSLGIREAISKTVALPLHSRRGGCGSGPGDRHSEVATRTSVLRRLSRRLWDAAGTRISPQRSLLKSPHLILAPAVRGASLG